jgi:hypothetical protein
MSRKDTPTPRQCPHCIGREKAGCKLCGGLGFVSRQAALAYERDREHRLTGQMEAFEVTVEKLIQLLEEKRASFALTRSSADAMEAGDMAIEGRALLTEFTAAKKLEPGNKSRSDTVIRVLTFQTKALAYLAGRRTTSP